jgi:hypothetical protein
MSTVLLGDKVTGRPIDALESPADLITITPTLLNADQYDSGDVLFDAAEIASAVRVAGGKAVLQSIVVIDRDDQKIEMDLVFLGASQSLGTKDAAPDIDDTEALDIQGIVKIGDSSNWPYVNLGGVSIATRTGIGLLLEAASDATSLFVAAITRGAPTHSTGGLRIKLGFVQA